MREHNICLSTGDIESMPFIEALRQLSFQVGMAKKAYFAFKLTLLYGFFLYIVITLCSRYSKPWFYCQIIYYYRISVNCPHA